MRLKYLFVLTSLFYFFSCSLKEKEFTIISVGDCFNYPSKAIGKSESLFLYVYTDYEKGLQCAKKLKKPILLFIDALGLASPRAAQSMFTSNPDILDYLNEHYLVIHLYADDRTMLPKEEWRESQLLKKMATRVMDLNIEIQHKIFNNGSQPTLGVLNNEGILISDIKGYTHDSKIIFDWLVSNKIIFDTLVLL